MAASDDSPPGNEVKPADYSRWALQTVQRGAWAPLTLIAIHAVALFGLDAYEHFPPIDIPMHFFGGVSAAYFLRWALLIAPECGVGKTVALSTVNRRVLAMTFAITVLWEIAEFWIDRTRGTHLQLGPADTAGDMFLGTLGAVALLACIKNNSAK